MEKELIEFLETKFQENREGLRGEIVQAVGGLRGEIQENRRHFGVMAEGLRTDIQQVAEGVVNLNEKLDRHIESNESAHREILSAIKFSYAELERRIQQLETRYEDLGERVRRLETSV